MFLYFGMQSFDKGVDVEARDKCCHGTNDEVHLPRDRTLTIVTIKEKTMIVGGFLIGTVLSQRVAVHRSSTTKVVANGHLKNG